MKTKISKIEQPFEFQTGEIYLLNKNIKIEKELDIITYEQGTPVKFIRKDNDKTATVMDSDKQTFSVPIDELNENCADELVRGKTGFYFQIRNSAWLVLAIEVLFTVSLGSLFLSLLFYLLHNSISFLLWIGLITLFVALLLLFVFFFSIKKISLNNKTESTLYWFFINRKENMRELKKLKSVNINTLT